MARSARPAFTTRPVISGTRGVVTTTHWLASQSAMALLERGGNAFDAAVTANFVLQVVEPQQYGLFGDWVAVLKAVGQPAQVLCGQGGAPEGATIEHYRRQGLELVPYDGLLAAVVPGAFGAAVTMLRDLGTISLSEALEPAIEYASGGYPILYGATSTIAGAETLFRTEWPSSAAVYLPGGRVPQPGDAFVNRDLAETFSRLIAEGEAGGGTRERRLDRSLAAFYEGFVAEAVERLFLHTEVLDASGLRHRGVLCGSDFALWRATYETPVTAEYRGLTICKPGPWSQGPVLLQILALMDQLQVSSSDLEGPEFVHVFVEAMKLAFADREAWYGDPNFVDVPLRTLFSGEYNRHRAMLISEKASLDMRPGSPNGRTPVMPDLSRRPSTRSEVTGDTCHIDVIDRHGNVVSVTPSGGFLHRSPVVPGLGSCLNNRAQSFWLQPDVPACLGPGRRPRTTLSPTLILRDGDPLMVCGTPGSDSQDQWIAYFLMRYFDRKEGLQLAIDAPALHTEHVINSFYPRASSPNKLVVESRVPETTVAELRRRGHDVKVIGPWSSANRMCAATRGAAFLSAAATPRFQQAYAIGR